MNSLQFAGLCKDYAQLIERITRLETLPARFWDADHREQVEDLRARVEVIRAAISSFGEQAS